MADTWADHDPRSELKQNRDYFDDDGWDAWESVLRYDEECIENASDSPCDSCHEECTPLCPYYSVALEKHNATLNPAEEDTSAYL